MSVLNEMNRHALREHKDREDDILRAVQTEAMSLELLPEGEEARGSTFLVDGQAIPQPTRRIHGKLTVRW